MNNVIPFLPASSQAATAAPGLFSDYMLLELLTMHEELLARLRCERDEGEDRSDFLAVIIEQHEKSSTLIHALLAHHAAEIV